MTKVRILSLIRVHEKELAAVRQVGMNFRHLLISDLCKNEWGVKSCKTNPGSWSAPIKSQAYAMTGNLLSSSVCWKFLLLPFIPGCRFTDPLVWIISLVLFGIGQASLSSTLDKKNGKNHAILTSLFLDFYPNNKIKGVFMGDISWKIKEYKTVFRFGRGANDGRPISHFGPNLHKLFETVISQLEMVDQELL